MDVLPFPAGLCALPHLRLDVFRHLILHVTAVHPVRPRFAVVAGDLERGAGMAPRLGPVALLAPDAARPATGRLCERHLGSRSWEAEAEAERAETTVPS